MTQLDMFTAAPSAKRPHKRQRDTARTVYKVVRAQGELRRQAGKETREDQVLRCLAACVEPPTARELYAWMMNHYEPVDDINSIRPRLTWLEAHGLIVAGEKRECRVSGKTVHTWKVSER